MRIRIMMAGLAAFGLLGLSMPRDAVAGSVDTPSCRAALTRAGELINAIDKRENSVPRGDYAGLCRLLRRNLKDMTEATRLMEPCLTGHDKGENLGQMNASMEDIRDVIRRHCQ